MFNKDFFIGLNSLQLVNLLKDNAETIDAMEVFMANGVIRATHYVSLGEVYIANGNGNEPDKELRVLDTGIDDEEIEYDVDEWVYQVYPDAKWWISDVQPTCDGDYKTLKEMISNNEDYHHHVPSSKS